MELSEAMVRYRGIHDLSQRELADMCHLTQQTINSIENGLQTPSRLTREKILVVIGREMLKDD